MFLPVAYNAAAATPKSIGAMGTNILAMMIE